MKMYLKSIILLAALYLFSVATAGMAQPVKSGENKPQRISGSDSQGQTAIAYDGRLLGDEKSTRLLLEFDGEVEFRSFYMNNPPRLVIDMGKTVFRLQSPDLLKPRGMVSDMRYGTMAKGKSRIVLSLRAPVKITRQEILPTTKGRYRFTLDLEKTDQKTYLSQIAIQRDTVGTSGNVATKGDRVRKSGNTAQQSGRLTIVLDPGHGGIDGGAKGTGHALEKDITLAVALQLEKQLLGTGRFNVKLTRKEDFFVSLKDRVKFTMRQNADLFISIHADTLQQKQVRGVAVYTLSKQASDELTKKKAEKENRADIAAGLAIEEVRDEVVDILADLAARETKKFSVKFARNIVNGFRGEINLIKNPHRFADFGVLKDPNVPSVLLELGYLSNKEDEILLQSRAWRTKLVGKLTRAVARYFDNRG